MKKDLDFGRWELKYFVNPDQVQDIRSHIAHEVECDPFARNKNNNSYLVRSLYFDTQQLDFYYEKLDGLKVRKKVRVRIYNEHYDNTHAFLEIKRKYVNQIVKERSRLPLDQLEQVCLHGQNPNGHLQNQTNDGFVLSKFLYNLNQLNLQPSLLVTYEREAFISTMDTSTRVTLDKNVSVTIFPEFSDLFTSLGREHVTNGKYILELKFNGFMPKWMRRLVSQFNIKLNPISKYCLGIDACRKNIRSK